jgi:hypothetical protein
VKLVVHDDAAATLRAGIARGDTLSVIIGERGEDGREHFAVPVGETELPALAIRTPVDPGSFVIETADGDVIGEGERS